MPLVFDPRSGGTGSRPKYLLVLAGGGLAALLLAVDPVARRRALGRANPLRWPVAALVGWAAVSAAASGHRATALSGFPGNYDGLWATVALATIFLAAVAAFAARTRPLAAIRVLWFGVGTVVLAFGAAQLVDRVFFPRGWDWARPSVSPSTIGSTLGNPNHLASLLAILLPLGVVVAVAGDRRTRLAVALGGGLLVAELAVTASRGGWAAAAAGLAVLVVLFRGEVRGRVRSAVLGGMVAALTLALLATVALARTGVVKRSPGSLLKAGPGSTVDLRLEVWAAAWRVAADHPIVGVGPDVFPVVFPAYETERFRWRFGPFAVANGAHNLFLNTLANLGAGGLAALLAVIGVAGWCVRRAWRRLPPGENRLLLGGVTAALVAYLVQGSFNTQETSLSLCAWVLLGLAVALAADITVADAEQPQGR